jgi:hypothetical protein
MSPNVSKCHHRSPNVTNIFFFGPHAKKVTPPEKICAAPAGQENWPAISRQRLMKSLTLFNTA